MEAIFKYSRLRGASWPRPKLTALVFATLHLMNYHVLYYILNKLLVSRNILYPVASQMF